MGYNAQIARCNAISMSEKLHKIRRIHYYNEIKLNAVTHRVAGICSLVIDHAECEPQYGNDRV